MNLGLLCLLFVTTFTSQALCYLQQYFMYGITLTIASQQCGCVNTTKKHKSKKKHIDYTIIGKPLHHIHWWQKSSQWLWFIPECTRTHHPLNVYFLCLFRKLGRVDGRYNISRSRHVNYSACFASDVTTCYTYRSQKQI